MKNEGFSTPNIWVITPKNEGFTWVPMVVGSEVQQNLAAFEV